MYDELARLDITGFEKNLQAALPIYILVIFWLSDTGQMALKPTDKLIYCRYNGPPWSLLKDASVHANADLLIIRLNYQ